MRITGTGQMIRRIKEPSPVLTNNQMTEMRMKKSFIIILLVLWSKTGICQNKHYHLLDYTCASCPPAVFLWNVDRLQAVEFGDYVEEYTDS